MLQKTFGDRFLLPSFILLCFMDQKAFGWVVGHLFYISKDSTSTKRNNIISASGTFQEDYSPCDTPSLPSFPEVSYFDCVKHN
jgi:hypothetical protein